MIIGIDNGLSGAIAVLSEVQGLPPVALHSMPVMRVPIWHRSRSREKASGAKARGKVKPEEVSEIDAAALKLILGSLTPRGETIVVFEDCPDHGDTVATMRSMAATAGKIMAVLELLGLAPKTYRIQSHTWQGAMLGKVPRGQTKVYAEAMARRLWPSQDWRRTRRSSTADTGFIDAALIAEWGRTTIIKRD